MTKADRKRLDKIYAKVDSYAKLGINGFIDYCGYLDEILTNRQLYIFQYMIERKYQINDFKLSFNDYKSEKIFNLIRSKTITLFQEDLYKLYQKNDVQQQGKNIYYYGNLVGTLSENNVSLILTTLTATKPGGTVSTTYSDTDTTLYDKYVSAINYLTEEENC